MAPGVRRIFVFLAFLLCCLALVLQCVAMATNYWVVSEAVSNITHVIYTGSVNFGLVAGRKRLTRIVVVPVDDTFLLKSEYEKELSFPLWIGTISCLGVGILFGVVSAIFSLINSVTVPIELITGLCGLYIWNTIAALLSMASLVLWTIQFFQLFRFNVLSAADIKKGWNSEGLSYLGYSYWLTAGATMLFLLNLVLVWGASSSPRNKRPLPVKDKPADGVIMLY